MLKIPPSDFYGWFGILIILLSCLLAAVVISAPSDKDIFGNTDYFIELIKESEIQYHERLDCSFKFLTPDSTLYTVWMSRPVPYKTKKEIDIIGKKLNGDCAKKNTLDNEDPKLWNFIDSILNENPKNKPLIELDNNGK